MPKQTIIKERTQDENGKWIEREINLDGEGDGDSVVIKSLIIQSESGEQERALKLAEDGALLLSDGENEYRILVIGINSQSGEVVFNNTKSMRVDFPTPFANWPAISLTMMDENNTPPYRVWPGKTGFTVRFKNRFTGAVSWAATEA